jgi:hypothetical protein
MSKTRESAAAGSGGSGPAAAKLLDEMRAIRSRTRAAAHAYWLPLLLFGIVICGSLPFYERLTPLRAGTRPAGLPSSCRQGQPCHISGRFSAGGVRVGSVGHLTVVTALGWYWQAAIPVAVVLTVLWYRWRANRIGLRTPARSFLVTGLVLGELVLLISLLIADQSARPGGFFLDTRHVAAVLVIAAVLWVLAWAERSRALAIIVAVFLVVALPVSYTIGGGLAGGTTGAADLSVAAMRLLGLIPALILLAAGVAAWLVQRDGLRSAG